MTEPSGPIEEPRLHASAEFPPPVGSPVGESHTDPSHHDTSPTPNMPVHRHVRRLRMGIALVAVVALGVVAALVLSRGGSPADESADTAEITTGATDPAPGDDPRSAVFTDAHDAYVDGRCADAVAGFDELLADSEWVATSSSADAALAEQAECNALLDIASDTAAPSSVLADYLTFLADRPGTPLKHAVLAAISELYATAGLATLTEQTCDAIDGDVNVLRATDAAGALLGCADVYLAAGRSEDAAVLAVDAISRTTDAATTTRAVDIVTGTPGMCAALAGLPAEANVNDDALDTVEASLSDSPTTHAVILQACMVVGADDAELLAGLQMRYLVDLPLDPGSAAVEAALIENAAACGALEAMRTIDELAGREGFLASKTLKCAQFAHYVGDRAMAIELYQWFLDNTEGDERTSIAEAGLAWNRIAAARDNGITEWSAPLRAGSSGGSFVRLIIRNDAWSELDVILTGPVTQFITVDESPDSIVYTSEGRDGCRLDVPSVTVDVPGGVYEVMFERNGLRIAVGTWDLRAGSMYDFCLYLVST